ncbi:extracellular solute-binding protein [Polycladidibacter stylochi]|uniref:extracellular solute-binding protein n=1 Tax=Polycladidibacter stylochi TaxID=1807766 RepID=UPI0008305A71|nr:extracellular solute-binding protein [Pseudovibrio stylochi]
MHDYNRRDFLHLAALLAGSTALGTIVPAKAFAQEVGRRHGISAFGSLKYAPGFTHFHYANPEAPKGGRFSMTPPTWMFNQNPQSFNSFNSFILKGDAPPRMELCFDTLMASALDEPDAMYGLVAKDVTISEDHNTYFFHLREEARFHDGSKLQADDVVFSFNLLKEKGHPMISQALHEVVEVSYPDELTVKLVLSGKQSRLLPLFVASLPIFSKDYYTRYDFEATTLTPPLASGPYQVGKHELGRFVEFKRVEDYWAKDLPVNVGHHNFSAIRIDFYREAQTAFEAFKKGDITFRNEHISRNWEKAYEFPAVQEGRVVKQTFPNGRVNGGQAWYFNTRREKFQNPLVREAIGMAFDFEWANNALFFGLYDRIQSYFENSDMKAEGLPTKAELALLEPYREQLPAKVFEKAYIQPVSNGSGQDRELLRKASELLAQAGLKRDGEKLLDEQGEPFTFEFLSNTSTFERVVQPFIKNLALLGITANFRVVDPAQFESRMNEFDFDVAGRNYSLNATFDDSDRQIWGSKAAETPGSYNLSGIQDPVVDALLDKAITAQTREEMNVAARALDRVLRAGHYRVPQWFKPVHTVAFWDMFGYPKEVPVYGFPIESLWWVDLEKAVRIGKVD